MKIIRFFCLALVFAVMLAHAAPARASGLTLTFSNNGLEIQLIRDRYHGYRRQAPRYYGGFAPRPRNEGRSYRHDRPSHNEYRRFDRQPRSRNQGGSWRYEGGGTRMDQNRRGSCDMRYDEDTDDFYCVN